MQENFLFIFPLSFNIFRRLWVFSFIIHIVFSRLDCKEKRVSSSRHIDKDEYHKQTHNEPTKDPFCRSFLIFKHSTMSERRKLRKFGRAQKEIPEFKTIMLHPKRRQRSQQEYCWQGERSARRERAETLGKSWRVKILTRRPISWGIKIKVNGRCKTILCIL